MNALGRHSAMLCCLLLVGAVTGVAAAGVTAAQSPTDAPASPAGQGGESWTALVQEDIDADSVELVVDITASGDAQWQVIYRLRLDSDADREAFSDLRADIETNTSQYLDPFEERITDTVGTAVNATDREMSARDFAVSTEREEQPQTEFGLVTFSYEWLGFATVEDETIRAGDAVDQLFLDEDELIEFRWPEEYRLDSSSPQPDVTGQQRVVYEGRFAFDAGQPRLVFTASEAGGSSLWLVAAAVGAVAVAAAAVFWWRRRESADASADAPAASAGDAEAGGDSPPAQRSGEQESEAGPPPELLSNEERVLQLLEQNSGRMKQKAVADRLDWSAAKTSQVVGDLRDADELESFRLGRENVLTLPDVDIDESLSDGEDSSGE